MRFNSVLKRIMCIMLALLLVFCTAACGKNKTKKKKKVIIKKVIVTSETESTDENTSEDEYITEEDVWEEEEFEIIKTRRELADSEENETEVYVPEFTQKTVDWNGPKGYVIVYKDGDRYANVQARYLQAFFKKIDGVELKIVTDKTPAVAKEILVGDTNRYKTTLSETAFAVNLKGKKLVFEGGHRVMVEKAVKWFMSIDRIDGKVATLKGKSDTFKPSLAGGYKYVWGEEFDGDFLDKTKFIYCPHMAVNSSSTAADLVDDALVRVEEGLFKMSTAHYFSEFDEDLEVGIAKTVCTGDTMQWLYGYAELRALVPFTRGAWPAWWATNYCAEYGEYFERERLKYMVEVDFFEVFGSVSDVVPNVHKWYQNAGIPTWTYIVDDNGQQIKHSGYGDMKLEVSKYQMPETEVMKYHTYGFKWTPDKMTLSVDGTDYMTFDLNKNYDGLSDMDHFKDSPLHMIINNFAYYAGGSNTNSNNELNIKDLPFNFFVDYIRIYQVDGQGYLTDFGPDKDIEY